MSESSSSCKLNAPRVQYYIARRIAEEASPLCADDVLSDVYHDLFPFHARRREHD